MPQPPETCWRKSEDSRLTLHCPPLRPASLDKRESGKSYLASTPQQSGQRGRGGTGKAEERVRQPQSQGKFKINLSCDNVLTDWLLERYGARRLCRNSENQREWIIRHVDRIGRRHPLSPHCQGLQWSRIRATQRGSECHHQETP